MCAMRRDEEIPVRPVSYLRATDVAGAVSAVRADPESAFLAGGTTEIDLLRLGVVQPRRLVDISALPLNVIEERPDGGLRIGALARMSDVAGAPFVRDRFPAIVQALLLGASPQLRNMASMGGNLLQRVRCSYFRDVESACNKRTPESGCAARAGIHRGHAVLGTTDHCIAAHPSDLAVALVALDAIVHTMGAGGDRTIPIDDFFVLPGTTPHIEHPLEHGELIVAIEVPPSPVARASHYLKIRDRESYEFALASVAVALRVDRGMIAEVRLALGGVATKPWRARSAERMLRGAPAEPASFVQAAKVELDPAAPLPGNAFKVELARRAIVRALETAAALAGAV
jgi:xanthine dehydrogenase YagS FAD-binding subunit